MYTSLHIHNNKKNWYKNECIILYIDSKILYIKADDNLKRGTTVYFRYSKRRT